MMHDLNRQLFEMVHSVGNNSFSDKLSALCLIGIPVDGGGRTTNYFVRAAGKVDG